MATSSATYKPEHLRSTLRADAAAQSWFKVAVLIALLPFYGQSFHYLKDVPALWAASKAWPVATLPLALILFFRPYATFSRQLLASFAWLLIVSSYTATLAFHQPFSIGLTAQIKLLPILSFFSFLGLLYLLQPSLREICTAFISCGIATMVIVLLLWQFAPQSWYIEHIDVGEAPLLSTDDRGNRIRVLPYYTVIALFYWYRRGNQERKPIWFVPIALALAILMGIVRTRAVVIGAAATLGLAMLIATTPRRRLIALIAVPLLILLMFQIPYVASVFDTNSSGFEVRKVTAEKAMRFMGEGWLNWTFGVGTISSIDPKGMANFFNHYFFLADVTWLGILFEFGAIGAVLLLLIPARGILFLHALRKQMDHPFLAAMQDYLIYVLLISSLYSTMTMQPGEVTVILATAVYCARRPLLLAARHGRASPGLRTAPLAGERFVKAPSNRPGEPG